MSRLEYHVLLALAAGPLYGYAIKTAVEEEAGGELTPRAASLYRVLARMVSAGLVIEVEAPEDVEPHPGRDRRYYSLTPEGRGALSAEARRLQGAAALAVTRLSAAEGRS